MGWVKRTVLLSIVFSLNIAQGSNPDWSSEVEIPEGTDRSNIYNFPQEKLHEVVRNGLQHIQQYPVSVTGVRLPYRAMTNLISKPKEERLGIFPDQFTSFNNLYKWLGLNPYNNDDGEIGVYSTPYPASMPAHHAMGATIFENENGKMLTFSCAACHSQSMFGKSIIGLTNKRPRANKVFEIGQKAFEIVPPWAFQIASLATFAETEEYTRSRNNLRSVGVKVPMHLGLDTSLAQVALSLAKRNQDEYATKNPTLEKYPRPNELEKSPADSKPAVWWNVKYKTRWLSDGSLISGNPIYTNFLWNEIGRGTDLKDLEGWYEDNQDTITELTAMVFNAKAPKWTDFFPATSIDLESAKRGEKVFLDTCKKCHGTYEKRWSESNSENLSAEELIETSIVTYHEQTPVKNVGTDPYRWEGMQYFADELNELAISKYMETVVEPQEGYVPPPLVGIWARYPYFHNGSVATLCDIVTTPSKRTKEFYQGPADNADTDFDRECVGYPVGDKIPASWKEEKDALVKTDGPGLSNGGHYKMWLNDDGEEKYSWTDKMDLIMFLKTL